MRIAIDAMGGDYAPEEIVKGVVKSALELTDDTFVLAGDENKITRVLGPRPPSNVEIIHTDQFVTMTDHPNVVMKTKKRASMRIAAQLVKDGDCDAILSAGNTGALLETSLFTIGRIKGIKRPGLGVFLPTRKRHVLLIDAGANADCRLEHILQFAQMGTIYLEHAMGIQRPRVGLVNIGEEPGKGNVFYREVYDQLADLPDINFVGNLEPRAMMHGHVDVAVADGFTGNLVLKASEAAAEFMMSVLKEEIKKSIVAKMAALTLKPVFRNIKRRLDQSEIGGALLLGLKGILVKCHGRANAQAIYSAIKMVLRAHHHKVQEFLVRMAQKVGEQPPPKQRTEIEKLSI